jgi:glutathione S-transferase
MYSIVGLVTLLALGLYFWMGLNVGRARGRFGIAAPATHGHPEFERYFRVQQNTLEWLVIFLPTFWLCAYFMSDWGAWAVGVVAVIGLVWVVGRYLYMTGYIRDPAHRSRGFAIQAFATILLFIGAVAGAVVTGIASINP